MNIGLKCEYHDGWIERVTIGPRQEVSIAVCLDTVWNPDNPAIELRFGGIFNFSSLTRFFRSVAAETSDVDGGPRINALHLDEKIASKPGDLYFYVDIEIAGHVRVHCKNVTEKSPE